MKIKSKQALQQKANFLFQDLEKDHKPCEVIYIVSEMMKTLSLVMLQNMAEEE